jgi:glutathione peroxidase
MTIEMTRRSVLTAAAGAALMAANNEKLAWDFSFPAIEGDKLDLAAYRARVLLVVNTASFCGYTYQYEGLQALYTKKFPAGLTVIGIPSQDFNQESADNATVKTFCETRFDIDFPLAAISHVRGAMASPFYAWVNSQRNWQPSWNFNKVLIGRDGRIAGTFGSTDEPDGPNLSHALDGELARTV